MSNNNESLGGYNKNTLRELCKNLENFAESQFDFAYSNFRTLIPPDVLQRIDRIVISGCGDSYLAAAGSKGAFQNYLADTGCEVVAPRIIDACRFLPFEDQEANTLVVAVSASGGAARVAELLKRGEKHGCVTMALTHNAQSRAAEIADYTYLTDIVPDSPGLGSYYASLLSLVIMAAAIREIRTGDFNLIPALREELLRYNRAFFAGFDAMDHVCRSTAAGWGKLSGFEVVADGALLLSGEFISAKYAEAAGAKCTFIDSENYCHVNGLMRPLGAFGTIVMGASDERNITRLSNTADQIISKEKRSVLLVCDKPYSEIGMSEEPAGFCRIEMPASGYRFLLPLYAFIPGSLMAGYHAELTEEPYFRGFPFDASVSTIATSKIVIV